MLRETIYNEWLLCRCLKSGQCYTVNASSWLGPPHLVLPVYNISIISQISTIYLQVLPIYGVVMPLLMVVTLVFNSLIMIVLTR